MPGICGIVDSQTGTPVDHALDRMVAAMRRHNWYGERRFVSEQGNVAFARVSLQDESQSPQCRRDGAAPIVVAFDGEIYSDTTTPDANEDYVTSFRAGVAAQGRNFLARLNGSFAAAIWDESAGRLTLCNDRFGSRPIYYTHRDGQFLFASNIAPLVAGGVDHQKINLKGVAQFFSFGHYFGDDTSVADVRVLPAGAWCVYDTENDRLQIDRYHRLEDPRPASGLTGEALLDRLDELFYAAVRRRSGDEKGLGLALSGGLDARTILGVMDGTPPKVSSVCYGMPGSLDDRASRQMCEHVGSPYRGYVLSSAFLTEFRDHLEGMVQLTDGQYLSQCIVMPTLPMYREWGMSALLRGHAGELLHMRKAYNYSIDAEALEIRSQSELESWLAKRLPAYLIEGLDVPVFRPNVQREIASLANESLREAIAPLEAIEPAPQRIWHLFLAGRLRRETSLSMVKFRSVLEPRLPYLDNDLIDAILATPAEVKLGDEIQSHMLKKRRPGFFKIVNANTGAPMGAGPLRNKVASFQKRVFAKLGLPGYQPYERLGLWLRREVAPTVRSILLDEQCLDRAPFSPDGIRSAVDSHLSGRRNHTFLLMALMIFELGQRWLAEVASGATDRSPRPLVNR
jgi:asparagine synthetase B (glutamine-hydrolysing)